jgi:outer membrane autotransporter protein
MTEWYSETTLGFGDYGWTEHPEQGQGSIVVDGAGSTLNYAGGLNVLNGSLQVANGGQVLGHERADAAWVDLIGWGVPADPDPEHGFGGLPGIAFAGISGEGSAWHSANLLSVGEGGQGLLEVTEGADASFSGYVRLGTVSYLFDGQGGSPRLDVAPATGQGNILVTGAGSTFDVNALDGTASWQHGDLFVGYSFGASGGVTIADGASSDIDGLLVAGRRGDGAVNILDGGGMSVHGIDANLMGMVIGESAGSGGEVVVGGPDATLVVDGGAQIGSAGTGSLLVLDGGAAEIGLGTAFSETVVGFTFYGQGADAAGGEGNILVDGAGSMLTYGGGLNVLNGAMTVSHGGTVESQLREADGSATWLDVIGFGVPADPVPEHAFAGLYGNGMVTVTGNGSTWTSHNGLSIANGGEGMLAVLDGGSASFTGDAYIGTLWYLFDPETNRRVEGVDGQPGSGTLLVDGKHSVFTLAAAGEGTGVLHVADGGEGGLEVRNGGTARIAGGVEVGANGYVLVGGDDGDGFAKAGTLDTPSVTLADPGAILAFAHSTSRYAFDGSILGMGQLLVGGDTTLTGDSGAFTGTVLVEGAPLTVTGSLGGGVGIFGLEGAASLEIEDGGSVHLSGNDGNGLSAVFGLGAGSAALATISGEGSQLVADAGAQFGAAGAGGLEVLDGATASIGLVGAYSEVLLGLGGYGTADDAAGGTGSIEVDGDGSALHYAGGLNVFNGEVLVSDGGLLQSHERDSDDAFWLDIIGFGLAASDGGPSVSGTGEVTLVGSDTSWASVNGLVAGAGGVGMLSVLGGASAQFTGFAEFGSDRETYDPFGNIISVAPGTGTLLVSGSGSSLTVAAVPGDESLAGTLYIGTGGSGTVTVNRGGTISASGIEVGNGGELVIGGVLQGKAFAAPGTIAAPVSLVGEDATLSFLHNDRRYVFDATISGDGFIHAGHGFTMLTADSSAFDGYTLVDGGATLSVNGSLGGDLMVAKDGRLQGSGTVEHLTVLGTLAPGNSPGTLNIAGDLVMESGSVFEAEIDPSTGEYDAIAVAGNVAIQAGTVLSVSSLGDAPLTPGISIDLIQTSETTTVEGQFSEVTGGSDFLGYGVDYAGGEINLNVTRSEDVTFEGAVGADFGGLGKTLDGLADDNALMRLVFFKLTSVEQAEQVLADMAGTMHADLRRELVDGSRHLRGAVTDRLATAPASGSGWWAQAMNDRGRMDAEGMWPSVEIQRSGVLVGYDMVLGETRLGAAIGTGTGEYDATGKLANADLRDRNLALYGSSDFGAMRLGYGLGVSWTGIESERSFAIGDVQQHLAGDRDARTDQLFVEAARRIGSEDHRFMEPFLSIAHVRVHDDRFEETGGLAALAVDGDVAAATFGKVGVRWALGSERAQWTGSVGMRYARGFDHGEAEAAFISGGDSFPIRGLSLDGNVLDISMGGRFRLSGRASLWAGYESLMGGNSRNDGVKLQLSVDL